MVFQSISYNEVDPKSPIDDTLMFKIKDNFDDLNGRLITAGNSPFFWEFLGPVYQLKSIKRSVGYGLVNKEFTPTVCRFMVKQSGVSGSLRFDIRKHTAPITPITGIDHQFTAATSSIARQGSSLSTQSVTRTAAQINTQSITFAKAAVNISSIIGLGSNLWRYNLASNLDVDWAIGTPITFASATAGGNNLTTTIVDVGISGQPYVTISNASGVAQVGAAGTAQPKIMSYNFTNPVAADFVAGRTAQMTSHTDAANNGTQTIYKVNSGGNNIWVINSTGTVQAATPGTVDVNTWKFALTAPASTTDYIVGERALTASHTSGGNNNNLLIVAVNSGGNNVVLENSAGVAQGGAAGTVDTNRWKYNLPSDPTTQLSVADNVYMDGHTTPANNGFFVLKDLSSTTIVVYNEVGVAQGGAAGNVYSGRKLVKFSSDQSANFTTDSYIEMQETVSGLYSMATGRAPFKVLQVNRGGGASYNVVIDNPSAPGQASPAGFVSVEMKSIFITKPELAAVVVGKNGKQNISGVNTDFVNAPIPASTPIMVYIEDVFTGNPQDLTILIS